MSPVSSGWIASRSWIALAGTAAAVLVCFAMRQNAGAQAGRPPQRPGGPGDQNQMMQMMRQRMEQMQKLRAQMQKLDAELDKLVAEMNRSKGQKKIDAMAAVINKLVQERRLSRQMMQGPPMGMPMGMGPGMMARPGGPRAGGAAPRRP